MALEAPDAQKAFCSLKIMERGRGLWRFARVPCRLGGGMAMRETGCWENCQLRGRVPVWLAGSSLRKELSGLRSLGSRDTL